MASRFDDKSISDKHHGLIRACLAVLVLGVNGVQQRQSALQLRR